jgi:hypothetical protein
MNSFAYRPHAARPVAAGIERLTSHKHVEKAKLAADRILPKPVDVNALLREMKNLLDARH